MAIDFSKPALTDGYAALIPALQTAINDLARGLEPTLTGTSTNVPTGTVRWNATANAWERFGGASWGPLAGSYAINISGSAATAAALVPTNNYTINSQLSFNVGGYIASNDAAWGMIYKPAVNGSSAAHLWTLASGGWLASLSSSGTFSATAFSGSGNGLTGSAPSLTTGTANALNPANAYSGTTFTASAGFNGPGSWQVSATNSIDVNASRAAGHYVSYASAATNAPTISGVLVNGCHLLGDGLQMWSDYNSICKMWIRRRWGGAYTPWGELLSENSVGTYSGITAGAASNLTGGSGGTIPYQQASGLTGMSASGAVGQYLQSNGLYAPVWVTLTPFASGQTWQDVTASRALSTTYTNSTGKDIMVSAWSVGAINTYGIYSATVSGTVVASSPQTNSFNGSALQVALNGVIVPAGATYSIAGNIGLSKWFELR
jgi:hypothetical protein